MAKLSARKAWKYRLLTGAVTAWVGLSLFWINYAPTCVPSPTNGSSHTHFERRVVGWPVVYQAGSRTVRYPFRKTAPVNVEDKVYWKSNPALALDIAATMLMIGGAALVATKLCRRLEQRTFSLADLCWIVLIAALCVRLFVYCGRPAGFAFFGGKLDGPQVAIFRWYSRWLLSGACWGAICGIVLVLHGALTAIRMMIRALPTCRFQPVSAGSARAEPTAVLET